jgi:hypothetical protein
MNNIKSTTLDFINDLFNINIFNNPIFDDYYIKTWTIFNSNHFKELWDLQTIINNFYE